MELNSALGRPVLAAVMLFTLAGISGGCVATRKFTRNRVNEKAQEVSTQVNGRVDTTDQNVQNNTNRIQANTGQIEEIGSVTRDHTGKIATLDSGLKDVDQKSQQAMSVGQGAQSTANKAVSQVSSLGEKFENRNHYVSLSEERIKFKFASATLHPSYLPLLDQIAQRLKENPDVILVMEGRTDSTGDETYNIRLGEKRLEAVVRYLVVNQGVLMHKVFRMSYGKDNPLTPNKTREDRAENRAVVMRVMGPSFTSASGGLVSSTTPTP